MKPPHRRGSYQRDARRVVAAANADPTTRCRRCGLTLAEHAPHKTGRPATWQAVHVNDGQIGGPLEPEASTCNVTAGARLGRSRQLGNRRTTDW